MTEIEMWTRERASSFLGTSLAGFDRLIERFSLRESGDGMYLAEDVAGLSEALSAETHRATPGWHGEFYRNGFARLANVIPEEQMALVGSWARERLAAADDQPAGAQALCGATGHLVRVNYLDQDQTSVTLIRQLPLAELAKELVDDAVLYRLSVVIRSKSVAPELGRHRDPRWSARRFSLPVFAFGLSIDSTPGETGDVYYARGSHRLDCSGVLAHVDEPTLVETNVPTERGDAVLHNLGVVHGAHRYPIDRERITIYCSFASAREVTAAPWGP
jgi:hypothetical protein